MANYGHPECESMKVCFDGGIKLEFHGANVTSNGGLLRIETLITHRYYLIQYQQFLSINAQVVISNIDKRIFDGILSRIERLRFYSV